MPNASQASESGARSERKNTPPPTMKFRGACSLNRKSSPSCSALNWRLPPGCQKFTSSTAGCDRSISNQSLSVTPTKSFIGCRMMRLRDLGKRSEPSEVRS
jgi:hypothetical protein